MRGRGVSIAVSIAVSVLAFAVGGAGAAMAAGGPVHELFIKSTVQVQGLGDAFPTATVPLYRGQSGGQTVWYIITESSDRDDAARLGVNWSPKLANALGTAAVQRASGDARSLSFAATVDFSPNRVLVPGPTGFPPARFAPGAVGQGAYSPLSTTGDGIVRNTAHILNSTGQHDNAVSVDTARGLVTMRLFRGFYEGKPIIYITTEGSLDLLAALEGTTFAPNLNAAPGIASNDKKTSARAAIVPIVNGQRGAANPDRQGLESAVLEGLSPLNITQERPGNGEYTPVWDVHPAVWTDAAIRAGERHRLSSTGEVANEFKHGNLVSFGAGPANKELGGLNAGDFISNCPIVAQLEPDKTVPDTLPH